MTWNVKIHGAGSIGNHIAHAARQLGWRVAISDVDPAALRRTRDQIYPQRYGAWDSGIDLFESHAAPQGGYDLIVVGTPPDSHMALAVAAVAEAPKAILVEKPLCPPDLARADELIAKAHAAGVRLFVGYDHVVGRASERFCAYAAAAECGAAETLDVEFREFWGGIFAAHPWLDGPQDTYLGYWRRGGGALGEHSHALNLWQHMAHAAGGGRVTEVSAMLQFARDGAAEYDKLAALHLRTESGLAGRVIQDVVTDPPRKWARLQGRQGYLEWQANRAPGVDALERRGGGAATAEVEEFAKSRADDFIAELSHVYDCVARDAESPIDISRGLDTMLVIAAAHLSAREGRVAAVDYALGYNLDAVAAVPVNG